MDYKAIKEELKNSSAYKHMGKRMLVTSLLSDSQEMLNRGQIDEANDNINIAKMILNTFPEDKLDEYGRFLEVGEWPKDADQ